MDERKMIYLDDALDALVEKGQASRRYKFGQEWELNFSEICEAFDSIPTSQPERKMGKWVFDGVVWKCSECGGNPTKGMGYVQGHDELYAFCPLCGDRKR